MSPVFGGGKSGGGGSDERARSAEAREQARLEREARRARKDGREPPARPVRPAAEPDPDTAFEDVPAAEAAYDDVPVPEPYLPADEQPLPPDEQPLPGDPAWLADDHVPAPEQAAPRKVDNRAHHFEDSADEEPVYEESFQTPPAPRETPPAAPAPRAAESFFDEDEDEPFADESADARTAPRIIPPRPALSWETDEPTRIDPVPPPDDDTARHRPVPPTRPDVAIDHDDDDRPVRVLGHDGESDRPVGVKRVPASAFATAAGADGLPRFGAPPRGRGTPRSRRGVKRVGPAILIIVLLLIAYGANKFWQPLHGDGEGQVRVVIPDGSGARQIGDQLADAGVVDNGLIFSLRARFSGDRDKLRSGPHVLKKDMAYDDAIKALMIAPKVVATLDVAIPEGLTIKQVGSLAHRAELSGSYTKATRSASARRTIRSLGAPKSVKTPEGFLFPATYRLRTTASTATLVAEQLKVYKRETAKVDYAYAKSKNLSRYDVLTIASLIENEAQTAKDRPLIAAVIYNRLKLGMELKIDATIRYGTGNYGSDARPIRQSELERDAPYNTYTRKGLPPTPISSPGLASLRAAARPAKVNFLYYVVKPCGNGAHAFSASDEKFVRDVEAYNAKREELGGKDPSNC
ncbi:Endolytic murein transglycosylase [Paraconexibacter sp. AEG42_29]|uniref:Endolytic murein transglycosylase n=1 Tax=Paraconexibacter sp. AEG42_29 TaxID=2997339 RepID=A0AAU7AX01_9ACTN